jgi:hypothetical protein
MTFQPGQSGNPSGRLREKPFRQALMMALRDDEEAPGRTKTKLDRIVGQLVSKALEGDTQAIKEVADRCEGKAPQQQFLTGDEDGGPMRLLLETTWKPTNTELKPLP